MAHHETEGRTLYFRSTEPVKFINAMINKVESSLARGFQVRVSMGGPDRFPTHVFDGMEISKKKFMMFVDAVTYWTRMTIDVHGRSPEDNEAETDWILNAIKGEVLPH